MKKFEEELKDNNLEILVSNTGSSLYGQSYLNYDAVVELSEGWVSPEDHQAEIGKIELQNLKYREEIARMQKALRKKNKAIKELNGAVKKNKARLKECEDLRIEANNDAAIEYSRKCEVVKDRAELKRENQRLRTMLDAAGESSKELLDINKKLRGDLGDAQGKLRGSEDHIKELKSQLEKQQPEIPEFVAEWIKSQDHNTRNRNGTLVYEHYKKEPEDDDYYPVHDWIADHFDEFLQALIYGYTVKEKRFYLKDNRELESVGNTCIGYVTLYLKNDGYLTKDKTRAGKFTQQEIDSMAADSYEQIEVEE